MVDVLHNGVVKKKGGSTEVSPLANNKIWLWKEWPDGVPI